MFVIRQASIDDAPTLLKLAKMVHFINLPADPDIIAAKINRSRRSFAGRVRNIREREFMLVLENTESGNVVGVSAIVSCISWPGHPHTFFTVGRREQYSEDLQSGHVHVTLELNTDETGPSEIGGLILAPSYRGHSERLGSLLSLVRFHFIGLHREWFSDRIIAEMMGALTPDSRNLLWEYLGRRFINLEYAEADRFCQHSKEFITSLFPRGEIYVTLLPAEARKLIGRVGDETRPARAMLERLGFEYKGHIDPFDGGPYLEAQLDDITLINQTRRATIGGRGRRYTREGFVSFDSDHGFRAIRTRYAESGGEISLPRDAMKSLMATTGDLIGLTPLPAQMRTGKPNGQVKSKSAGSKHNRGRKKQSRQSSKRKK